MMLVASKIAALLVGVLLWLCPAAAFGHPVPRGSHDRTIVVQLTPSPLKNEIVVAVRYRLEVDELTVALEDMIPFHDRVQRNRSPNNSLDFYDEFTRIYAPIIAGNLLAQVDGKALSFQCEQRTQTKTDENGTPLGHLRCDFVFRATCGLSAGEPHLLTFREANYELKSGQINLFLDVSHTFPAPVGPHGTTSLRILSQTVPDAALQAKPPQELRPGDDDKRRELTASLICDILQQPPGPNGNSADRVGQADGRISPTAAAAPSTNSRLLELFLASRHGFAVLLLLSALIGAAHALTPGHGKTLVAAYLVGQRGTVGQACFLGLVTAITHTGVVLSIAVGLLFVHEESRQKVANALGLGMGIALVCLGMWLLLQRLAGRADHFHLAGHRHEPSGEDPEPATIRSHLAREGVGWGGLIVMGMTGGMIPCWDAVALLGWGIAMNLVWMALPMLLAFSAGLASVLVLVGILVVHARKLVDNRWSDSRAVRVLPIFSALFIAGMGLVICYQGTHGVSHGDHIPPPAKAAGP
jgi:nickel/cobalt transporter (NicO) family protein